MVRAVWVKEGEYGVAETLSKAKNTSVQGLVEAGVITARGGKVKLLGRDDMPEDWDPATDERATCWEATQHLIRRLQNEGEQSAAELLARLGGDYGEMARDLAYRLYSICERKGWAQEALAYNALVIAWSEIGRLSRSSAAKPATVRATDEPAGRTRVRRDGQDESCTCGRRTGTAERWPAAVRRAGDEGPPRRQVDGQRPGNPRQQDTWQDRPRK